MLVNIAINVSAVVICVIYNSDESRFNLFLAINQQHNNVFEKLWVTSRSVVHIAIQVDNNFGNVGLHVMGLHISTGHILYLHMLHYVSVVNGNMNKYHQHHQ